MPYCEWCGEQTEIRDDLGLCYGCSAEYWNRQQQMQAEHDYYQATTICGCGEPVKHYFVKR